MAYTSEKCFPENSSHCRHRIGAISHADHFADGAIKKMFRRMLAVIPPNHILSVPVSISRFLIPPAHRIELAKIANLIDCSVRFYTHIRHMLHVDIFMGFCKTYTDRSMAFALLDRENSLPHSLKTANPPA